MEAFYDPHELTPEGMGDLLTRSVGTPKHIFYDSIKATSHSFSLHVEGGALSGAGVWYVERTLTLDSKVFNADRAFVPDLNT